MSEQDWRALPSVWVNQREERPRKSGITEVRGPYYTIAGPRYLEDLFEIAGPYIDWLKIPGPAIALMPRDTLVGIAKLSHAAGVKMSAGGLIEKVVTQGPRAVEQYFDALPDLGFDVVEVSAGMIALPAPDYLRLVERAARTGLTVKAEVGIQFGAGGTSSENALEAEGQGSVSHAIKLGKGALEAGADFVILESEGVTESVRAWRTDVPAALAAALGLERLMFEAADPRVFEWYVKNFGPEVNLFVDHSQALLLESVRSGVWGSTTLFNRVVTYKGV
jgi:phosphosulfolactate synthase (CoM biosynthesis protein A)